MTYTPFTADEIDAKSPIDEAFTGKMNDNFEDLDSRLTAAGNSPFHREFTGRLRLLAGYKRAAGSMITHQSFTPAIVRYNLKQSGLTGTIAFDIRKHSQVNVPITGIDHQYTAATQSVGNIAPALATQSITRTASQISTQTITHAKAALNVQSIVSLGGDYWLYNFDSAPDSDYSVGDSILFASCSSGGNNGTFSIVEKNRSGGSNVVISNASGVAQTTPAGTGQLKIMSYNFTNPVNSEFTVGESAIFASHTTGANNGTLAIYKVNQGGNNIWVKNSTGATQGAAAGTTDVARWRYTFLSAPSSTDFVVAEKAKMASHTTGANNGNFTITAVNALSIDVYNTAGVAQGGAAGTVNTNRWTYSMPTDPSSQVSASQTVYFTGHTSSANDGTFTVKQVNRSSLNNIVVYNESGVTQAGVAGTVEHTRKLIKFSSDQSASFTTDSYVEMWGVVSGLYNFATGREPFRVLQVNRGGGSNYNIVIDNAGAPSQTNPAGFVMSEMKSILTAPVSISASVTGNSPNLNLAGQSTNVVASVVASNTPLGIYFSSIMTGDPKDLLIVLN
jgi:hypothetical protein